MILMEIKKRNPIHYLNNVAHGAPGGALRHII